MATQPAVDRAATAIEVLDERLRRATAAARVLVYDADLESGKTAVHGFEALTGLRPTPENTTGAFWHSRIHADDLALHLEQLEQQSKTGGVRRVRYRVRHASDRWLYVEDTREIVLDAGGRAKRILGAIVDETERTESDLAIRRSEAEYRSLFESTGIANAEIDLATGRFVRVNRRYCELLGYSAEELLGGMTFLDVTHPDDRERNVSELAASENSRFEITKRYVRKDRSIVWVQLTSTPIYDADGHVSRLLGSAIDVTARQNATDALRAAADQLRFITDHVPVLILHCDAEARYRFVNAPYAARFGLAPEQLVGQRISDVVGDEAYETFRSYVEAALRGERAEFEQQIPYRYGTRWMHGGYEPERDAAGRVVGLVAVVQDVTDRHEAVEGLKRELRTNEMFVGVLSHDLRNPLGGVLMAAELGLQNAQTAASKKTFDRIAHSARRMLRMIEQLLDLTRIRMAHGLELRRVPSDLGAISEAVVEELEAANPGAVLVLEMLGDTTGCWDPDRLGQLVSNLVGNAIQHASGSRQVVILVDGTDAAVVKLRVHNSGTIPANVRPVLFEPFKRAAHDGAKPGGLGLGLYVAKQVALAHGGDLQSQSGPECGTTFELVLPREQRDPAKTGDAALDLEAPIAAPMCEAWRNR